MKLLALVAVAMFAGLTLTAAVLFVFAVAVIGTPFVLASRAVRRLTRT